MSPPMPAKGPPERIVLEGRYVRLEPIGPQHVADLYAAASSGDGRERFTYLFEDAPTSEADMAGFVQRAAASNDPLVFAVVDLATGRAEGRQSLMRIVPEHGVIEVGGIYWGPNMARSRRGADSALMATTFGMTPPMPRPASRRSQNIWSRFVA